MIYKHNYQRIALDTDRMMITQCGNDYHDYSKDKLACIYVRWAEEHCPERLQEETNKGRIYVHIDERITECVNEKRYGSLKTSLSCRRRKLRLGSVCWYNKKMDRVMRWALSIFL